MPNSLEKQRAKDIGVEPTYCPWCGAEVTKWGHDDDCKRPLPVVMIVGHPDAGTMAHFVAVP